jgi:hypothetical protein
MTAIIRHPRNVTPIRSSIYDEAMRIALSAGDDWPRQLAAAQTLSQSPDWTHTRTARHIREAYSLHLANVVQADPIHRAKSDMVDRWKASALAAETPMDVARRFAHRWPEVLIWGALGALALLWATGWL